MARPHRIIPILVAALAVAGTAAAQSESELRRENQRLRTELADLRRELDAARVRIAELEQQLGGAGAQPVETAEAAPAETTIDESIPNASPRALLGALERSYEDQMQGIEIGDADGDTSARRDRTVYLRTVERWAKRVNRELRSQFEWHVRLEGGAEQQSGRFGIMAVAVDPVTGADLGDPFPVTMSKSVAHRLDQMHRRGSADVVVLRGVLIPRVVVNPDRDHAGPFDNPPLIGPLAEFGMTVEASSFAEAEEEEERD